MKLIVTADRNWGIGRSGKLLATIPADLRFFQKTTDGHPAVTGRRSVGAAAQKGLPKGSRLIVLSGDPGYACPGAETAESPERLLELLADADDAFVIGGSQTYRSLLPLCDTAYVTRIDYLYEADAFFPNLDEDPGWELADESEEQTSFDLIYTFRTYRRVKG